MILILVILQKGADIFYFLIWRENTKARVKLAILLFSRVCYDTANKVGFLVAEIRDNIKVGIIKLVLLQEKNGLWSKVHEDMIEIW